MQQRKGRPDVRGISEENVLIGGGVIPAKTSGFLSFRLYFYFKAISLNNSFIIVGFACCRLSSGEKVFHSP